MQSIKKTQKDEYMNLKYKLIIISILAYSVSIAQESNINLSFKKIIDSVYQNNFQLGACSQYKFLKNDSLRNLQTREFAYSTPMNEFKQSKVLPNLNSNWNDTEYEYLIKIARDNNQIMRAHCPISPQCSDWVKEDNRTPEELNLMLVNYFTKISSVLEQNKDVIKWMDVVNETVVTKKIKDGSNVYLPGDWFGKLNGSDRWENPWTQIGFDTAQSGFIIPKYIPLAFKIAQQNAPNIKLLYNHHGLLENESWDKIKQTVIYLRNIGLRVDAIGWQAHILVGFEKDENNLERLQRLIDWSFDNHLEFHITELDVKTKDEATDKNAISDTYEAILSVFIKNKAKGATALNFWSLSDRVKSENEIYAGLLSKDLKPNHVFNRLKNKLLNIDKK